MRNAQSQAPPSPPEPGIPGQASHRDPPDLGQAVLWAALALSLSAHPPNSPRKLKEKRPEGKSKNLLPVKDTTEKLSMLEFKLCPDGVFKNTNTVEDQKDLQHTPRKEQAPVQGPV